MENLNLEKFSPKKAELIDLSKKYESLEIKGIDDKEGYELVDVARKDLKKVRVQISKDGKMLRQEALDFQKAVIAKEKELIQIIEPVEKSLEEKQNKIDIEKEKIVRKKLLPERIEKLKSINININEDLLLLMDENKFTNFFNEKKAEYLEEKEEQERLKREKEEEKLREEKEKLEAEKRKIEEDKLAFEREMQHQKELEETRTKVAEQAAKDAELKIEQAKKEAEDKAKREKEEAERKAKEVKEREEAERVKLEKKKNIKFS